MNHTVKCEEHEKLAQEAAVALAPLEGWKRNCHAASLHLVKSGVFEPARVARGVCLGVTSQHSWVVLAEQGIDCWDQSATIIDPTLWSYDDGVEGIWVGTLEECRHRPHGSGRIFEWGKPVSGGDKPIELEPVEPFSDRAELFLKLLGPLDRTGWARLAGAPVEDWPAEEILPAINQTVGPLVPIDIIGMLTDYNPGGLYLAGDEREGCPPA